MLSARCFAFFATVTLLGCHGSGFPLVMRMCRETPGARPTAAPAPPPPAHPDFERLRAYRNYYSIARVGEYEHHFAVWFGCVEPSVVNYAISPEGVIRRAGGYWGGLAVRDGEPAPIPDDQLGHKRAILARHAEEYDGESSVKIAYLGSYREVVVSELVPMSAPGDPYARMVGHATATLRASADLTTLSGHADMQGGATRMCWRDIRYRDCTEQAWIDFAPRDEGTAQLPSLVSDRSPLAPDERARFQSAVLAAARRHAAGEPKSPLDPILARQGDTLLPPGLNRPLEVGFTLYARAPNQAQVKQEGASLTTKLPVRDALEGVARSSARTRIAGIGVTAEFEMSADGARSPGERGEVQVPLRIRYRLADDRGHARTGEVAITAAVLLDGDASVVQSRTFHGNVTEHIHDPPMGQSLPGMGPFAGIDAYFGIEEPAAVPTWWPGAAAAQ